MASFRPACGLVGYHTGGAYSAAAAAGGAARTVSVDCDKNWLAYLDHSLAANGVENPPRAVGKQHDAIYGDCFDWLKRLAKRGERRDRRGDRTFASSSRCDLWRVPDPRGRAQRGAGLFLTEGYRAGYDWVILDPPSTSTVNGKRWSAARDYKTLAALAAPLVAPRRRNSNASRGDAAAVAMSRPQCADSSATTTAPFRGSSPLQVADSGRLVCTTNCRKLKPRQFATTCAAALRAHAESTPALADVVLERVVPPAVDHPTLAGKSSEVKNLVFRFLPR